MIITGAGEFVYKAHESWANIPDGWAMNDVAGVGVDRKGSVYLFNRGEHPVIVLSEDGKFQHAWGDKTQFPNAHAVTMGPDDTIWLTDTWDHTARKFSLEGELIMTLGASARAAEPMSGHPFNQCTHVAIHPHTEEIFVSDGYGNAKVHKFSPHGKHLLSWGEAGNAPGQFNLPHNICTDRDGYVYVADRHNGRVQVFTQNGRLEHIWSGMALPCGMCIDTHAPEQLCYIAELSSVDYWMNAGSYDFSFWNRPGMGPRISIYTLDGRKQANLLDHGKGPEPGRMIAPHSITVDAKKNIYVGECSYVAYGSRLNPPQQVRNIWKLEKLQQPAGIVAN